MFWDIAAMVLAGFLLAGLVMPIKLFYKKTPKWLVPLMAGIGMMGYQVVSEYTWFANTSGRLPKNSIVVANIAKTSWFRPWSYIKPQVFQFVVLDTSQMMDIDGNIKQAQVYFFERRMPAQKLDALFDCQKGVQTYIFNNDLTKLNWQKLDYTSTALTHLCQTTKLEATL